MSIKALKILLNIHQQKLSLPVKLWTKIFTTGFNVNFLLQILHAAPRYSPVTWQCSLSFCKRVNITYGSLKYFIYLVTRNVLELFVATITACGVFEQFFFLLGNFHRNIRNYPTRQERYCLFLQKVHKVFHRGGVLG